MYSWQIWHYHRNSDLYIFRLAFVFCLYRKDTEWLRWGRRSRVRGAQWLGRTSYLEASQHFIGLGLHRFEK